MSDHAELRDALERVANAEEHFVGSDCDHCDPDVNYTCPECYLLIAAVDLSRESKKLLADYDRVAAGGVSDEQAD